MDRELDLIRYDGQDVIVEGKAENVPHNALLVGEGMNEAMYVLDQLRLREWPESVNGQRVRVRGTLLRCKYIPDPALDKRGRIRGSGIEGLQYVLEDAVWAIIPPEE